MKWYSIRIGSPVKYLSHILALRVFRDRYSLKYVSRPRWSLHWITHEEKFRVYNITARVREGMKTKSEGLSQGKVRYAYGFVRRRLNHAATPPRESRTLLTYTNIDSFPLIFCFNLKIVHELSLLGDWNGAFAKLLNRDKINARLHFFALFPHWTLFFFCKFNEGKWLNAVWSNLSILCAQQDC